MGRTRRRRAKEEEKEEVEKEEEKEEEEEDLKNQWCYSFEEPSSSEALAGR